MFILLFFSFSKSQILDDIIEKTLLSRILKKAQTQEVEKSRD